MPSYTWKITDATFLKQIKSAANEKCFNGPTFTLCNLRWYLNVYPNGCDESSKGSCDVFLNLVMLPTKVSKIAVRIKLTNTETDRVSEQQAALKESKKDTGWPIDKLKTKKK
eukprot:363554_1